MISKPTLIWDKWINNLESNPDSTAIVHFSLDDEIPHIWTQKHLFLKAIEVAAYLKEQGIQKGDVCAIMLKHNKYFYPIYMGASLLGAVTTVLAYKNPKLHAEKFIHGLEGMSQKSGLDWLLTDKELDSIVTPIVTQPLSTIKKILFPLDVLSHDPIESDTFETDLKALKEAYSDIDDHTPFLLQHSSGTTGLQKGVTLSHKAILDHASNYSKAISLTSNDKVVSWLPLYHDMGLIAAFTIPLIYGIPSIQIDPFDWVMEPVIMLELITSQKATLCWMPNFAYNMMADKIHEDDLGNIDLSSIRMMINCSEPVKCESHQKFSTRFARYGLKEGVMAASYAMAETTFAITQTTPGQNAKFIIVDRNKLANGEVVVLTNNNTDVSERHCTSSGRLIDGCEIKIIGHEEQILADSQVGELLIRSQSLFDGYKNNPTKTAESLKDGWFHSGDLGFCYENEYYIVGRKKDIIIVAGKNIYPEDIESVIGETEHVIPGRVVAFGAYSENLGTDQIHLIIETHLEAEGHKALRDNLFRISRENDFAIAEIHVKPHKWLIKSSSGKLSRNDNKVRILNQK